MGGPEGSLGEASGGSYPATRHVLSLHLCSTVDGDCPGGEGKEGGVPDHQAASAAHLRTSGLDNIQGHWLTVNPALGSRAKVEEVMENRETADTRTWVGARRGWVEGGG